MRLARSTGQADGVQVPSCCDTPAMTQRALADLPKLTTREWRDVQAAVREIEAQCHRQPAGVWHGLARLMRPRAAANDDHGAPQRWRCNGTRLDLARHLEQRGFSPAQIAAVALITG